MASLSSTAIMTTLSSRASGVALNFFASNPAACRQRMKNVLTRGVGSLLARGIGASQTHHQRKMRTLNTHVRGGCLKIG